MSSTTSGTEADNEEKEMKKKKNWTHKYGNYPYLGPIRKWSKTRKRSRRSHGQMQTCPIVSFLAYHATRFWPAYKLNIHMTQSLHMPSKQRIANILQTRCCCFVRPVSRWAGECVLCWPVHYVFRRSWHWKRYSLFSQCKRMLVAI